MIGLIKAFVTGGILCVIAQILLDKTKLTPARILVIYVIAGVALSGVGLYGPFADWASCGASTPLSGFGHLLAKGVKEAVDSDGLIGCLTGGLTAASGGVTAAMISAYLASLVFKSKSK